LELARLRARQLDEFLRVGRRHRFGTISSGAVSINATIGVKSRNGS
jgi:hypothetical protein